jgi:hypothetical protein
MCGLLWIIICGLAMVDAPIQLKGDRLIREEFTKV